MIEVILNYEYMENAVWAALFASIICAIMGTIIVEKRLVSMSGGIAHASFGGIGLGFFLKIEPIVGGLVFALLSSLGVGYFKRKTNTYVDTVISMFWAAGMAIGILFVSITPGYPPDMTSYLFGDILAVNKMYIIVMGVLAAIIFSVFFLMFNYWKIFLFDEEYAKIMGLPVIFLEISLYALVSLSIVVLIKVVGVILSIAMLTVPPAISKLFTKELKWMIFLSGILGVIFSFTGLAISYYVNIPSGATIILVSILSYFIAIFIKYLFKE